MGSPPPLLLLAPLWPVMGAWLARSQWLQFFLEVGGDLLKTCIAQLQRLT